MPRNIGINRWSLPNELELSAALEWSARAGFESFEINLGEPGSYLSADTLPDELPILDEMAKVAEIPFSGISTSLLWGSPLTDNDPAKREKGKEIIAAQIEAAFGIGLDAILVVPGVVTPEVSYDVAYERALSAIRELAPVAEKAGVAIGVENVWNKFLLSPLEFARFLDEVNSSAVRAYFDVGNILLYGYPEQWIRILGERIVRIHVKDFKTSTGNMSGFCNPCQGDVPWGRVRDALDSIGYDNAITAEINGTSTLPELGLKQVADALKAALTS